MRGLGESIREECLEEEKAEEYYEKFTLLSE